MCPFPKEARTSFYLAEDDGAEGTGIVIIVPHKYDVIDLTPEKQRVRQETHLSVNPSNLDDG